MKYFQEKININRTLLEGKNKNDLNEKNNSDSKVCKSIDTMNKSEGEKNSSFGNNKMKN